MENTIQSLESLWPEGEPWEKESALFVKSILKHALELLKDRADKRFNETISSDWLSILKQAYRVTSLQELKDAKSLLAIHGYLHRGSGEILGQSEGYFKNIGRIVGAGLEIECSSNEMKIKGIEIKTIKAKAGGLRAGGRLTKWQRNENLIKMIEIAKHTHIKATYLEG